MSEQTGASCSHWVQVQWPYRGFDSGLWFHCCSLCGHITDRDGNAVKIVPADAVCITPEIAATAAEACGEVATNWDNDADFNDDDEGFRAEANRYRAAADALRGEG